MASGVQAKETVMYRVEAATAPWTAQSKQFVGLYPYRDTAETVARFVRETFMSELRGGIDVSLDPVQCRVVDTPAGRRLENSPGDPAIYLVTEELDLEEYQRLLGIRFMSDSALMDEDVDKNEENLSISVQNYFCLSGKIDRETKVIGYYKSADSAQKAMMFFQRTHPKHNLLGTIGVTATRGEIVQLSSGMGLRIDSIGNSWKVLEKLDRQEYLRLMDIT